MKNIHTIVVVGLGYVGLPLAHAFSKHFRVIGYDLSEEKIALYRKGIDPTNELGNETVKESTVEFTNDPQKISEGDFIVVAVPTPVNQDQPAGSFAGRVCFMHRGIAYEKRRSHRL